MRAPLRRAGRRAPAAPADLALKLLLRHSDWWERLSADDHKLLHSLAGTHGAAIAWLERQLVEHGPLSWGALESLLSDEDWQAETRAWASAGAPDEEQGYEDLHRVVQLLRIDQLGEQARAAAECEDLELLRQLREHIAQLKAGLARAAA